MRKAFIQDKNLFVSPTDVDRTHHKMTQDSIDNKERTTFHFDVEFTQ